MTVEEEEDNMRNITIPETEGHHEVEGPQIENPNITVALKMRQVNIGTEAEPKFVKIGDHWDDSTWIRSVNLFVSTRIFSLQSFQT